MVDPRPVQSRSRSSSVEHLLDRQMIGRARARSKKMQVRKHSAADLYLTLLSLFSLSLSQPTSKWMGPEKGERACSGKDNFSVAYSFGALRRDHIKRESGKELGLYRWVGAWRAGGRAPYAARQSQKGRSQLGRSEGRLQESNKKCCCRGSHCRLSAFISMLPSYAII